MIRVTGLTTALVLMAAPAMAQKSDPPAMLAPNSISLPNPIVQMLMIYLADRPGVASQLQQQLAQAAQAKAQACPIGK